MLYTGNNSIHIFSFYQPLAWLIGRLPVYGVEGCGFESWPKPSNDLLSISLLISETFHTCNYKGDLNIPFQANVTGTS